MEWVPLRAAPAAPSPAARAPLLLLLSLLPLLLPLLPAPAPAPSRPFPLLLPLGAASARGAAALPRGNPALGGATGHAPTQRTPSASRRFQDPSLCCLEAGNAAALSSDTAAILVYGAKDWSCIKPCFSPDKRRGRGIAEPGLPGRRQIEDA